MVDFDETASRLRAETSGLVKAFRDRAQKVRGAKELLLLIKPLDEQLATRTALELFGESQHRAVGIDGSMMTDELLEMIVFYANACAFGCSFEVTRSGIEFALDTAARDSRLDVSCTVPLWIEDIPSIVSSSNGEGDYGIDAVSDKLPFAVMAMAELMTADRVLDEGSARILFMDRPISGTYGPLARDYRELLRRSKTSLEGWQTPYGELTKLDMALAYHLHDGTLRVPRRRRHLFCHALKRLLDGEKTSYESLSKKMKLDNGGLMAVKRMLRRIGGDDDLLETGMKEGDTHLKMTDEARDYWKRVSFVKEALLAKVFGGDGHPLQLDQGTWVNSLELNSMNVILLREVIRKSIENRVLLVGIAKDTLATEFGRTVVPYSGSTSSTSSEKSPWSMRSDKSLLSIFSTSDELDIPTPWRTIGYDGAFSTLVAVDPKEPREPKLVAARRRMASEGQFVRSYFELRSFSSDPKSKSSVFLYDRPFWADYDHSMLRGERVREERRTEEALLYFEQEDTNPLDNLILKVLSCSDNPNVIEAFGHNHLLFLADKAVKADAKTAKSILKGVVWLELGPLSRTDRMFNCARRFRDIRSESERARERMTPR